MRKVGYLLSADSRHCLSLYMGVAGLVVHGEEVCECGWGAGLGGGGGTGSVPGRRKPWAGPDTRCNTTPSTASPPACSRPLPWRRLPPSRSPSPNPPPSRTPTPTRAPAGPVSSSSALPPAPAGWSLATSWKPRRDAGSRGALRPLPPSSWPRQPPRTPRVPVPSPPPPTFSHPLSLPNVVLFLTGLAPLWFDNVFSEVSCPPSVVPTTGEQSSGGSSALGRHLCFSSSPRHLLL